MKPFIAFVCLFVASFVAAQKPYFQQHVRYNIDVTLNEQQKTIKGFETLVYTNNSAETLDYIWFHIWPNAYSNEQTAFFEQLNNDTERKKKIKNYKGGSITDLSFTANGKACVIENHPKANYVDIIKVVLPTALKPGDSVTIATPFTVTLPSYFSRSGYADDEFMICQWYPKPAVFDNNGWHEMPYLDMGEFYSEFGNFVVNITVPSNFVVAATGVLQDKNELAAYKNIGLQNATNRAEKPILYKPLSPENATKTLQYKADSVLDFAWFAEKNLVIQYDTIQLESGRIVDAFTYYHNYKNTLWKNSIDYVKDATKAYSSYLGEYQYPVVQAIEGPKNNSSGGMEYPMITLITSPDAKIETLDGVIAHEVGHNWLMGFLASNERENGWMDEGINTYFQFRYEAAKYRHNSVLGSSMPEYLKKFDEKEYLDIVYKALIKIPAPFPIATSSEVFKTSDDYGITIYLKTAIWLYIAELTVGKEALDKAFKDYFNEWKFKHPQPSDLKKSFEKSTGKNLDELFSLLNKKGNFE